VCDQASDLANLLGLLEKKADDLRAAEKAPVLQQTRDIDGKWKPVIARAKSAKVDLKRVVIEPWLKAEPHAFAARTAQRRAGRRTASERHEVQRATGGTRGRTVASAPSTS
jgi:hypothetical protein